MDLLDVLRRQAGRFQCPKCGKSLADCRLELVAQADAQSLVRVTCSHCEDERMIAVALASPTETEVANPVRDEPIEDLGTAISTDDVLDARLALDSFDGDLRSLVSGLPQ
jgi:transcription elongation factor Elf1